jgi:hypothetical protein
MKYFPGRPCLNHIVDPAFGDFIIDLYHLSGVKLDTDGRLHLLAHRSYRCGGSAGAACQSFLFDASFISPDPQAPRSAAFDKIDIRPFGSECCMGSELAAEPIDIKALKLLNKQHGMWNACIKGLDSVFNSLGPDLKVPTDVRGRSHLHEDEIVLHADLKLPVHRLDKAGGAVKTFILDEFHQTSQAVAAHLGFRAIAVENPHPEISGLGFFKEDHAVSADSFLAMA